VERGWRVVAFDFRGHGDSRAAAARRPAAGRAAADDYGYDDLVALDLPAVCAFARARAGRKLPVVVVGHSLGGHAALAAQGTGAMAVDAVVAFASSPWVRAFEPSPVRWWAKRAQLAGVLALARRVGRLPARLLRLGSDDEPLRLVEDFARFARIGWASADGRVDYLASLARVGVPVLQVVSEGDRRDCPPACGARTAAHCGPRAEVVRVSRRDDGGPPPGHMGLVTSGRVRGAWERVEGWMRANAGGAGAG